MNVFISVKIICFGHFQQGSYENSTLGYFARVGTAKCIVGCNHNSSLEDNHCVPFFPPLRLTLYSPKPSNIYRESSFVGSVSGNKLEKYTFLWFKKDFHF